jgi:protein subunit release factor A
MKPDDRVEFKLDRNSITKQYTCSRGNGGQNINRLKTCVILTHIHTGIMVRSEETRNQKMNTELAYQRMYEKLKSINDTLNYDKIKTYRNNQIGNDNTRPIKRRTYRIKENLITDHISKKSCTWKDIRKGRIDLLK